MNDMNQKIIIRIISDNSNKSNNILNNISNDYFQNKQKTKNNPNHFNKNDFIFKNEIINIDINNENNINKLFSKNMKNILCIILEYSITNRKSFQKSANFLNNLNYIINEKDIPIILIGNQKNIEEKREISKEEGKILANKNGIKFFEYNNNINFYEFINYLISFSSIINNKISINCLNNISNPVIISIISDESVEKNIIVNNINPIISTNINNINVSLNIQKFEININEDNYDNILMSYGIILVYNINKLQTFKSIENWINKIKMNNNINFFYYPKILIGLKNKDKLREVSYDKSFNFSNKNFIDFYEISSHYDLFIPIQKLIKNIILLGNNSIIKKNLITINNDKGEIITYLPEKIPLNNECFGKYLYNNKDKYEGFIKNNKRNGKGKMIYSNKDKYKGEWLNDNKNGYGQINFNNGDKYKGEWLNDKINGYGIYEYKNGDKYKGNFINNLKEGKGIYYYKNNSIFEGNYKNDKREGFGIMHFNNGEIYEGNWKNDKINGYGKYSYNDKKINNEINSKICKIYEGEWKDELWNGDGKIILNDGTQFIGIYNNGEIKRDVKILYTNEDLYIGTINNFDKDGYGIMKYNNGDSYFGNWKNDKKNGEGKIEYNNGNFFEGIFQNDEKLKGIFYFNKEDYKKIENIKDYEKLFKNKQINNYIKGIIYEGNFKNDNLIGKIIYINPKEYFYEGDMLNNKRNGMGKILYINGDEYIGEWKNNKKEGNGTMLFNNNDIYIGKWNNDKIEGEGLYQFNDGNIINGNFNNEEWLIQIEMMKNSNFDNIEFFCIQNIKVKDLKRKIPSNKIQIR